MLLSILILISVFLIGEAISRKFLKNSRLPATILFGVLAFTWTLAIICLILGFRDASIFLAIAICILLSFFLEGRSLVDPKSLRALLEKDTLAIFVVSFIIVAYAAHLSIGTAGGLYAASSDPIFHLGIINTISQGNFPPIYPNLATENLSYYYFADLFIASLVLGGFGPLIAFQFFIALAIGAFVASFYSVAKFLTMSRLGGLLAIFLMFIVAPCTHCQAAGSPWFSAFFPQSLEKSAEYGAKGFPIEPVLLSFPFSQPPLAIAFLFFAVLLRVMFENQDRKHIALIAASVGLMPFFHIFQFFTIMFLLLCYWYFHKDRLLEFGILAAFLIALPQLFYLIGEKTGAAASGFLRPQLYAYSNNLEDMALFWLLNIGGHLLLGLAGWFLWKDKRKDLAILALAALALFIIGNFVQLSPYVWDSDKIFLPFLLLMPIFAAYTLLWLYRGETARKTIFYLILAFSLLSAYQQFLVYFHPSVAKAPYPLFSSSLMAGCEWAKINTPKNAVFLTSEILQHSGCISAFGARKAYLSYGFWAESHGYDKRKYLDFADRMLAGDLAAARAGGITHVLADVDLEGRIRPEFRSHLSQIYSEKGVSIYEVKYPSSP